MARSLWGKVYYQDVFAGFLHQEPGDRYNFSYDKSYLDTNGPAISYSLPLQSTPHYSEYGLHPFFDNLVAEGWLENAQTRILGKRYCTRFELLLAFGTDCAGAVSVIDPQPQKFSQELIDPSDPKQIAILNSRASLSGIQPKLALINDNNNYRPIKHGELSTHIAKFPSSHILDIVENEWLTTVASKAFLPNDAHANMALTSIDGLGEKILLIERFDRQDNTRIHFEEFNQLLNKTSSAKYDGSYQDMAIFMRNDKNFPPTEIYKLYKRILVGILLGNTDLHFKNFACIYLSQGLTLAPIYDQVASAIYPEYQTLALAISHAENLIIGNLKAKNIIALGREFGLNKNSIFMAVQEIKGKLPYAMQAVQQDKHSADSLKQTICNLIKKRWNGTFDLIGQK